MQSLFRTKEVTVLELKVKIGELSVDQVEDLIFERNVKPTDGKVEVTAEGNKGFMTRIMAPAVAAGLRNADEGNAEWFAKGMGDQWPEKQADPVAPGTKAEKSMTPQRACKLGYQMVSELYREIANFSGLKVEKAESPNTIQRVTPGEEKAATTKLM